MSAGREGLSETDRDDVPWGRPVVDGIPIPPFADAAAHRTYLRSLQTFVLLLDTGDPSAVTIALAATLEAELPRAATDAPRLSALALSVSLSTFVPAPWTPEALALALDGSGYGTPVRGRGGWSWGGDPDYTATRVRPGWRIERHERGSRTHATLPDDGDLTLLWMDMFRSRFPYPIAHTPVSSVPPPEALAAAARATLAAHSANVAMPYLQSWREERDRAGANGPGEVGRMRAYDVRLERAQVNFDDAVVVLLRILRHRRVGAQLGGVLVGELGDVGAPGSLEVGRHAGVVREQAGSGAVLGAHVADGRLAGAAERGRAGAKELHDVARAALDGQNAHQVQDDVFGAGPAAELAGELDADDARPAQAKRLANHHVDRVRAADADGHHAEAAGVGGV